MVSGVHRPVRSFVRREGRITPAQRRALSSLWPRYGLDPGCPLKPRDVFGRQAPLTLEIGFGNGEALVRLAQQFADRDFIGIEVHRPGVGRLLLQLESQRLSNVRVYSADAVEVLGDCIADSSLDRIHIFFPDPWPKKRHHKRRLINDAFVSLLCGRLKVGGIVHIATDWPDYADWIEHVLTGCDRLQPVEAGRRCEPARQATRFEQRGIELGLAVREFLYWRCR